MPGEILIRRGNGRSPTTYGVNSVEISNMKSAFLCLVILVSSVASASGDVESYPGLRFNFNNERKPRVKKHDRPYYQNVPFKLPLEEYEDTERNLPPYGILPETIRQLREIINWEKEQLNEFNENRLKILRNNPIYRYDLETAAYREVTKPGGGYMKSLDEARMYPQDDDFGFESDEEVSRDDENVLDQPAAVDDFRENHKLSRNEEHLNRALHEGHAGSNSARESFTEGRFKDAKVVSNPSEFAYAPSDPMFYKKVVAPISPASNLIYAQKPIDVQSPPAALIEDVRVNQRSGIRFRNDDVAEETLNGDSTDDYSVGPGNLEVVAVKPDVSDVDSAGVYIIAVVAGISAAATVGLIAVGIGWYNLQKHVKNGSDLDYPAYGVTGPNKDLSPGERRLAQSAQMYHYQHQKQQIISMERVQPGERHGSVSEAESDEENEEGDYTVYECPGLAPTGEMEVKNPLFQDDPTPAQGIPAKPNQEAKK